MSKNDIYGKTDLDAYIESNLPKVLAQDTANSLGDRSKYIGASDIGSCLRKAYLSKKHKVEYDIAQHIVFERGHLAEGIVEKMIQGTNYKTQVEAVGKADNGFPIKAHIDFTIENSKEVVVLEAKSTSIPVQEPYESWVLQTQLQIGLLKAKYPNKIVRGYVIAIDVNTGWYKTFKIEPNSTLFDIAMKKANTLADSLYKNNEPEPEQQLYCSKCPFKDNCKAIDNGANEQLPLEAKKQLTRLANLKKYEKQVWSIKKNLTQFMEATNRKYMKSGNSTIQLVTKTNDYDVDIQSLKIEQPKIYAKYRIPSNENSYKFIKVI